MKRLFLVFIAIVVLSVGVNAFGAPFLCCDPYTPDMVQPSHFEIVVNGGEPMEEPAQVVDDWSRLHMDLGDWPDGEYNLEVKACNEWGCSSAVFFDFTKGLPGAPVNIFLEF